RGELGYYMVSDGTSKPYRVHIHGPSFGNLQGVPKMIEGCMVADVIASLGSMDFVLGDTDRYHDDLFTATGSQIRQAAHQLSARPAALGDGPDAAIRAGRGGRGDARSHRGDREEDRRIPAASGRGAQLLLHAASQAAR